MKDLKQGEKALVYCTIDACMTGYKKKQYRINLNGTKIWVDLDDLVSLRTEAKK